MKSSIAAGLGALAAVCLVASAVQAADTTVTMWTFLDPTKTTGRDKALKELITRFEAANPGVKIKVEPQVFSELGVKFLLGHRTGTAPDITFVNAENLGALLKAKAAADLQKAFVAKWPEAEDKDFYMRAAWDAGKVGAERFAVPLFPATAAIFYRKDLLAAAGIDPAALKTWDQLTAAAKTLTRDADGDGRTDVWGFATPLSPERTGGTTAIVSMLTGGQDSAWDGETCKPRYATPVGEKAIQLHADWINVHKVMSREVLVNNTDDLLEQFAAGRIAIVVAPFARYEQTRKTATWGGEKLGVMPWPNWTDSISGPQIVTGWFAAVWSKSPRAAQAAKFVEAMVSADGVRTWSTTGGQVPTRTSVFKEPQFQAADYDYIRTIADAWTKWSFMLPSNCNTTGFDADLNVAVHRVALGEAAPAAALKEAEAKFLRRQ